MIDVMENREVWRLNLEQLPHNPHGKSGNEERKKVSKFKNLNVRAEIASSGGSKFENFIFLLQLDFVLKLFEPPIVFFLFFSLKTRITRPLAPKICTKVVPYFPYLSSEFQVSTLSCFGVITISASGCRKIVNFAWKTTIN